MVAVLAVTLYMVERVDNWHHLLHPPHYVAPVPARKGHDLYALGLPVHSKAAQI